jgi:hypothetical protein
MKEIKANKAAHIREARASGTWPVCQQGLAVRHGCQPEQVERGWGWILTLGLDAVDGVRSEAMATTGG